MPDVVAALSIVTTLALMGVTSVGLYALMRTRLLRDVHPPEPEHWPRLTLVVPACNEESTLESALRTVLAADYPDLELLVVNDRSTDGTGAIVDRIAAEDPRVKAVHVTELPAGWLGKVHAMHVGAAAATGSYVLYTDADIHFAPGALRRSVALMETEQLDHLAMLPVLTHASLAAEMALCAFGMQFMVIMRPDRVGKTGAKAVVGVGAFNMVRRTTFERTPGWEWLRMEVADDTGLALLMHNGGGKAAALMGTDMISVTWYATLPDAIRGLEKNMYGAAAQYSPWRLMALVLAAASIMLGPWLALATSSPVAHMLLTLLVLQQPVAGLAARARLRVGFVAGTLGLVGGLLNAFSVLRSGVLCERRGGVSWRGTFYPLKQLRAGLRVKVF